LMIKQVITCILSILFVVTLTPYKANATTNDLPECVVITHCVREDFKVNDIENAFKKATKIVSETARTKIVEKTDSYIHAEAKTKWRRYTDDLLLKAIPEKVLFKSGQNQELALEIMESTRRELMILLIV
jgi:uncharacterized protein (DUF1499 family)